MEYKKIFLLGLGHLSCDVNAHALPALLPYLASAHGFDYQSCGLLAFAYSAISSGQPGWAVPAGFCIGSPLGLHSGQFWFYRFLTILAILPRLCGRRGGVFHPRRAIRQLFCHQRA
jgi:FSR family fosmidomycin resistance protein-like MFS transporter